MDEGGEAGAGADSNSSIEGGTSERTGGRRGEEVGTGKG